MTPMDFTVKEVVYPAGMHQTRHTHAHSNVTVIAGGELEEAAEGGVYRAIPSSVVLKAAAAEHEDRVGSGGAKALSIRFARDSAYGRMLRDGAWMWIDTPDVVRRAIALQRAFAAADAVASERCAAALVEAVIACYQAPRCAPEWIGKMRAALDQRFDEPIRFDALARDFALHPVYASRAFRRHVGMSMTEYVQSARLRDARRQLATMPVTVTRVAMDSGFADASHLCRTFSARFGLRPTEYRRMTRFSAFNA